jgi:hypothetical protein
MMGSIVGSLTKAGYLSVHLDGRTILLHRLIWKLFHGEDPGEMLVDHVNRNRTDNRISNLRLLSAQNNLFNMEAKGYSYDKTRGKYLACITRDYKFINLGYYDCPLLARLAYEDAKSELHKIP